MGQEIGKRDKRNPGHCWQDNELYEVFQPVIGYVAAHVFAVMTRWCFGSEVRLGLRDLAAEAGPGRSTVHRATLAMQAVGMIRISDGRGRASASYELLDLKEAARALGAQWDQRRCSYALNKAQIQAAKKRIAEALACVPQGDAKKDEEKPPCVPRRDATAEEKASSGCGNPPVVSQLVSQNEGVCVPNPGTPSITQRHKDIKTKPTPVSPPASGTGSVAFASRVGEAKHPPDAKLELATEKLCRAMDVADDRQRRKLGKAIAQYAAKERMSADEAATAMVESWREYREALPVLRFPWGPVKFITRGHWRNTESWRVDEEKLRRANYASVGMVQ